MLESGWLTPNDPILNFKFLPITALSTYHKVPRANHHHPFPKSHGHPKSMNKLTLNKPAKIRNKNVTSNTNFAYNCALLSDIKLNCIVR